MTPLRWLADLRNWLLLRHYLRQGLKLGREVRIIGKPDFGSEPYLIEIGDHVMFANHCFVGDSDHRYDDPDLPVTWQGFVPRGPVRIGSNAWFGVNCVVTGGVEIGERCVIGANSVVTQDLPPGVIAAGVPAKVLREIEFKSVQTHGRLADA